MGSELAVRRWHKLRRVLLSPGVVAVIQPLQHELLEVSLPCGHWEETPGWGSLGGGWDLWKRLQEEEPHLGKIIPSVKEGECSGGKSLGKWHYH